MRARSLAALCATALLLPATGIAVAAEPSPTASPTATPAPTPVTAPLPPTVTPVCATDLEFVWKISSDATLPADHAIEYTTKRTQDWTPPNGGTAMLTASTLPKSSR